MKTTHKSYEKFYEACFKESFKEEHIKELTRWTMKIFIYKLGEKFNINFHKNYPRNSTKFIKSNLGKDLIGVEIGVFKGRNALSLLKTLSIKKLYLIDPYDIKFGKERQFWYRDVKEFDEIYKKAKKVLYKYKDKILFVKKISEDAFDEIPNNLDFVYIDGNHTYDYVKVDTKYYSKLKEGGILGGHDFTGDNEGTKGVVKAVIELVNKYNIRLYTKNRDWWVIKGANK